MYKTGPISQVEGFYIEHHYKTSTPQELADLLGRKVETVKSYIKKNLDAKVSKIKAGDHFARSKGTVVMTETASMLGDVRKSNTKPKDCITKIKNG
jgi:hypothetical protein